MTLDAALTMTDLTENGGEWRNEVKMGFEKLLGTEFYQPLDRDQQFYARARYQYEIKSWDLFDANKLYFELDRKSHRIDLGLGYNYVKQGRIELGLTGESGVVSNEAFFEDLKFNTYGAYFKFGYDTLDSISFPTSGNRFTLNIYLRNEEYEEGDFKTDPEHSLQIEADWKGVVSVGNHSFVGKALIQPWIKMATLLSMYRTSAVSLIFPAITRTLLPVPRRCLVPLSISMISAVMRWG